MAGAKLCVTNERVRGVKELDLYNPHFIGVDDIHSTYRRHINGSRAIVSYHTGHPAISNGRPCSKWIMCQRPNDCVPSLIGTRPAYDSRVHFRLDGAVLANVQHG